MIRVSAIRIRVRRGFTLMTSLVLASIAAVVIVALSSWFSGVYKGAKYVVEREFAFQIAEAGLDYYRWHLAKWPNDFKDGTNAPGPYIHNFEDADGNVIGRFELDIATTTASSIVTVTSTGIYTAGEFDAHRTLRARYAIPSLAKFAAVVHEDSRFGEGTIIHGPIHSNGGIRFDGVSYNVVSSALTTYSDPDHSGAQEYAVHTHVSPVDPLPNATLPARQDVFVAGRKIGEPAFSFSSLTTSLSALRTSAQGGIGAYYGPSGGVGYEIVLKTNDTYDLYRVTSMKNPPGNCPASTQSGWASWTVNSRVLLGNYAFPTHQLIFLEDHVWVSGAIDSARLTIAAARFPDNASNRRNIIVNSDITYSGYDGEEVLGLVAQNSVLVGLESEDDLRIDAALVAQNGTVGRMYYAGSGNPQSSCGGYTNRSRLILYGMIASYERYGFAYTDDTGYQIRDITYDADLLYAPPPMFPLASSQYETISWEEITD